MKLSSLSLSAGHFVRARWHWKHLHGESLRQYQEVRAQQIVNYAQQHSAFYREHWSQHDPHAWRTLPVVNKQLMMQHFDTFNTRSVQLDDAMQVALRAEQSRDFLPQLAELTVGLSSGTSGHRGLFLVSPQEQASWAGAILARTLHDLKPRRLRVAFFLRSNSNLYEEVGKGLIQFRYFDLMTPLAEAVQTLNRWQPHIVIGPPSLLGLLADEQARGDLHVRPERLISVAEVLEAHDRERLQKTFGIPVHQIYQCTEGFLATSCVKGSLHMQEDLVAVQFEAIPGSNGERVMPIITDLWRQTQPIIRYQLNDILELERTPCACGSTFQVIRSIDGRCDDLCYFVSNDGALRPFFPDTIRRMILLASSQILDYQVIQEQHGHLRIHLSVTKLASFASICQTVQASVDATIAQYSCRAAKIQIEEGLPVLAAGVKRRRVQCVQATHQ